MKNLSMIAAIVFVGQLLTATQFVKGNPIVMPGWDRGGAVRFDNASQFSDYVIFSQYSATTLNPSDIRYPPDGEQLSIFAIRRTIWDSAMGTVWDEDWDIAQFRSFVRTDPRIVRAATQPLPFSYADYGNAYGLIVDYFHIQRLDSAQFEIMPVKVRCYRWQEEDFNSFDEFPYKDVNVRPNPSQERKNRQTRTSSVFLFSISAVSLIGFGAIAFFRRRAA